MQIRDGSRDGASSRCADSTRPALPPAGGERIRPLSRAISNHALVDFLAAPVGATAIVLLYNLISPLAAFSLALFWWVAGSALVAFQRRCDRRKALRVFGRRSLYVDSLIMDGDFASSGPFAGSVAGLAACSATPLGCYLGVVVVAVYMVLAVVRISGTSGLIGELGAGDEPDPSNLG